MCYLAAKRKIVLHAAWSSIFPSLIQNLSSHGVALLFPWEIIPELDRARTYLQDRKFSIILTLKFFYSLLLVI